MPLDLLLPISRLVLFICEFRVNMVTENRDVDEFYWPVPKRRFTEIECDAGRSGTIGGRRR